MRTKQQKYCLICDRVSHRITINGEDTPRMCFALSVLQWWLYPHRTRRKRITTNATLRWPAFETESLKMKLLWEVGTTALLSPRFEFSAKRCKPILRFRRLLHAPKELRTLKRQESGLDTGMFALSLSRRETCPRLTPSRSSNAGRYRWPRRPQSDSRNEW